jgi:cytochrome c553
VVVGLVLCGLVAAALYDLPALSMIPPAQIADTVTAGIPPVARNATAVVTRGRYLYTVASCAFCNGNEGGGGAKISWIPFRTQCFKRPGDWHRWLDGRGEVRNGVAPDGGTLHWQGTIWAHASSWDEEDVRAIIAYVRTLPPVARQITRGNTAKSG